MKDLGHKTKTAVEKSLFGLKAKFECNNGWSVSETSKFILFLCRRFEIPNQGWKIHVSAQASELPLLLDKIQADLENFEVSFKIISSYDNIIFCNSGEAGITQIGKILTIYPNDENHAYRICEVLDSKWNSESAPTPPSDMLFRENGSVSLRYGAFNNTDELLDTQGILRPAIVNNIGLLVPDIPSVSGQQYDFAPTFPSVLYNNSLGHELDFLKSLDSERYYPLYPMGKKSYSSTFVCIDRQLNEPVLIKIYCKRSGEDKAGFTSIDRAKNEITFGRILSDNDIAPTLLNFHEDNYFLYVVYKYITGKPMAKLPILQKINLLPSLFNQVRKLHEIGIVHRDLKLSNVLIGENDSLYLIDFEFSSFNGNAHPPIAATQNYQPPEWLVSNVDYAYDMFSLGSCIIDAYSGVDPGFLPINVNQRLKAVSIYLPESILNLVQKLYDGNPLNRPSALDCKNYCLEIDLSPPNLSKNRGELFRKLSNEILDDRQIEQIIGKNLFSKGKLTWQSSHPAASPSQVIGLNTGISGVLLGLSSVLQSNQFQKYSPLVEDIFQYILYTLKNSNLPSGLFTGTAGAAFALASISTHYSNDLYIQSSYTLLLSSYKKCSKNGFDFFSGLAGIAYSALKIHELTKEFRFLSIATKCLNHIIKEKVLIGNMFAWKDNGSNSYFQTGMAHGVIGIAFTIATYAIHQNDDKLLNIAKNCFRGIFEQARSVEKGFIHDNLGKVRRPTVNNTWCHGGAGALWALIQIKELHEEFDKEIRWLIEICSSAPLLSTPTYCHGMAGALELWRLCNSSSFSNNQTELCYKVSKINLLNSSQKIGDTFLYSSESGTIFSPDLWVGYLGPITALQLDKKNSKKSILNLKWN